MPTLSDVHLHINRTQVNEQYRNDVTVSYCVGASPGEIGTEYEEVISLCGLDARSEQYLGIISSGHWVRLTFPSETKQRTFIVASERLAEDPNPIRAKIFVPFPPPGHWVTLRKLDKDEIVAYVELRLGPNQTVVVRSNEVDKYDFG